MLSYVEGWHVIAEANRVFGFEGWDREIVWCDCVWEDGRRDPKACAYAARVRIRVRAGDGVVSREAAGLVTAQERPSVRPMRIRSRRLRPMR